MADDLEDIAQRVDSLEKRLKMLIEDTATLWKTYMASDKDLRAEMADLKKQVGDPKEIADLKSRVKELEAKLGKMKK
jgi:tetrahydromethanopterin S-methyltransferase subunit G